MPSKFIGFDVIKILADRTQQPQGSVNVNVFNVTTNSSFGTLTTDAFGFIATQEIAVSAGTRLKFSVTGYTNFIERVTAAEASFDEVNQLNLILEDNRVFEDVPAKSVDFFQKDEDGNPVFIAQAVVGETFKLPYLATDKNTEFFLIPKDDKGVSHVTSLADAPTVSILPNLETLTPDFVQSGSALNARINFVASNITVSKFRKIQIADNSSFTTNLVEIVEGNNNQILSPNFFITRSGDLTAAKTVYVRIWQSSNNVNFDKVSPTKSFTFAASGGGGGSSPGLPPINLTGVVFFGGAAELRWNNQGGSSANQIYQNGSLIDTVANTADDYSVTLVIGDNDFYVQNDDGQTNVWSYAYYGDV